jgi:hypothetical protein
MCGDVEPPAIASLERMQEFASRLTLDRRGHLGAHEVYTLLMKPRFGGLGSHLLALAFAALAVLIGLAARFLTHRS